MRVRGLESRAAGTGVRIATVPGMVLAVVAEKVPTQ
jgi:hypothetical protein